jgi:hypothetical protein
MMAFLDATGKRLLLERLVPLMAQGTAGFWDTLQHCRMAFLLALSGCSEAREALYGCFRGAPSGGDVFGALEILALDGVEGFSEMLRLLRQREPAQRWPELVPTLVHLAQDLWEELDPLPWLKRWELDGLDEVNVAVCSLETALVRSKRLPPSCTPPPPSDLEAILSAIDSPGKGYGLGYQCRSMGHEVAGELWSQLLRERCPARLSKLLRCFGQSDLPQVGAEVIALADHPSSEVRFTALRALSRLRHPRVRALGLRCLARKRWRSGEVTLLNKNYEPGDSLPLRRVLVSDDHQLISDLTELCKSVAHADLQEVMMFVYEHSPCSNCREAIVKLMRSLEVFPKWAEEEWPWGFPAFSWEGPDQPIR